MIKFLSKFGTVAAGAYFIMLMISPQKANFLLALVIILAIPALILRQIFLEKLYKYSVNMVSKQFVIGENTLSNQHCTVKYTPDEKIIVMDNFVTKKHEKRMFTLKKENVNVNRCWNRLCRVFDSFINLDSLASFFSYDTKVDVIIIEKRKPQEEEKQQKEVNIKKTDNGPKFVELAGITPDSSNIGLGAARAVDEKFVDINNLKEQKPYEKQQDKAPEFTSLEKVLESGSNKIDVNTATASEISILPGINIVMAKKIVEYRDKNGLFKDIDTFFKVSEVKEHFIEKIRPLIIAGKPVEKPNDDDYTQGRIVDF